VTRSSRPRPLTRFISVVGPEQGLQKVGLAIDPQSRLAAFQTASPFDLLLHASVAVPFADAHAIERQAHRLRVRSCVRNEWFETTPTDAIAAVHAAATPWIRKAQPLDRPVAQPSPSEWRISRAQRRAVSLPDPAPLMRFGRQFRPTAAFHKPPALASLPLFDFQSTMPASVDVAPDTPIEILAVFRMELHCCGGATTYPLSLLAQSLPQGGRTPLAAAIGLFRCEKCRQPTREAVLVEQDSPGSQSNAWRVELRIG
jgi:hypothetical protein